MTPPPSRIPSRSSAAARAGVQGEHHGSHGGSFGAAWPPRRAWLRAPGSRPGGSWRTGSHRGQRQPEPLADRAQDRGIPHLLGDAGGQVLHQVADLDDTLRDPLGRKVGHGGRRRHEQPPREMVGHDPVDLLGHAPVEASEPRLDVRDRDAQLGRRQRPDQRGVRVAVHEHGVRPFRDQDRLQALQHPGRLLRVRATADAQRVVRSREVQLREEGPGHRLVPVLAGVHEHLAVPAPEHGR